MSEMNLAIFHDYLFDSCLLLTLQKMHHTFCSFLVLQILEPIYFKNEGIYNCGYY